MVSVVSSASLTVSSKSNSSHHGQDLHVVNVSVEADGAIVTRLERVHVEEVLIVLIIVFFWFVAFMAFLKKWDSIRIMQPMEPRYKHSPKNLENIKIVKRPQDSIIYKNYSRKMSTTMVAREKRRLQRMHTMPCLGTLPSFPMHTMPCLGTLPSFPLQPLPIIHMEEVTTEM